MRKFNYFFIAIGLWIGTVTSMVAQNRYEKDKLYNICPFKALDKALGYEAGNFAGKLKALDTQDKLQQWSIRELSGSYCLVNVFEDKAVRAETEKSLLTVTQTNGSDEAQLWTLQKAGQYVRLVPANTPSLLWRIRKMAHWHWLTGQKQALRKQPCFRCEAAVCLFQKVNY